MSLNDSSAIILIVGAVAILAFVIHGLWFSGRSINRKLRQGNSEDQEILKSSEVGKVRIVCPDLPSHEDSQASGKIPAAAEDPLLQEKSAAQSGRPASSYELNLLAVQHSPYRGSDLVSICDRYGFLRGDNDIFVIYENPETRKDVVFRICSLKEPFSFPADMDSYETPALALYMNLPEKGKAYPYFKAMRMAAEILIEQLGGSICDNDYHELSQLQLDETAELLRNYDESLS